MARVLILLLIPVALLSAAGASAQTAAGLTTSHCGLSQGQIAALDQSVRTAMDSARIPGVSLALHHEGVTCLRAYGSADLENRVPVTEDTVFWVMSVNKPFTAAAIMRLAESGQLSLDDPLARFLPEFPRAQEVTLRHLLGHTAGVREFLNQPVERRTAIEAQMRANPARGVSELVTYMAAMVPDAYEFAPGTDWKYSNSNYLLLGAVIERASGMPWQDYLRRNFFEPVGMRDSAIDSLRDIVPHRARGYVRVRDQVQNARDFPRNLAGPAGSLRSTARDLLRWQLALMNGEVLSADSVTAMSAPARLTNGQPVRQDRAPTSYGLGFMLNDEEGRRTVGHIGNFEGFETVVQTYPEHGLTLAVLTNMSGGATMLAPRIAGAVLQSASLTER